MARRGSRKRRRSGGTGTSAAAPAREAMARGYVRGRAKDDAARAALRPLEPGERPAAVTVGAIVAAVAAVANVVALVAGYDPGEGGKTAGTVLGAVILAVVAAGMWRARYWAVLGMQTLLALTVIISSLALLTAINVAAALLAGAIVAGAGALFWFLVKAMARIQMPPRPGAER